MADRVVTTVREGVADVRLNRPEKLNALDFPMFEGLAEAGRRLAGDKAVRAVVLSGEGRAFSAGLDFASFMAMASGSEQPMPLSLLDRSADRRGNHAQHAAFLWHELPMPVIAAVHGVAFGGGLQIALGADIRIVAADARLSVMEIKWGLVPDMSGTQTLRHLVRLDVAKELAFTGRVVSGSEAAALGLATRVAEDPYAAAMALAREIAGKSPDAIRASKRLLNQAWLGSVEDGLRLEEQIQLTLIGQPNQIEAVQAGLARRDPVFADPR